MPQFHARVSPDVARSHSMSNWKTITIACCGFLLLAASCGEHDETAEFSSRPQNLTSTYYFSVPESTRSWIDTGVDVNSGDRVVFSGGGSIWAGFIFIGWNGPDGFNEAAKDKKYPVTTTEDPRARPFSLVGSFGGSERFQIGSGVIKSPSGWRRVYLRTNDDTPANGRGAFDCTIWVDHSGCYSNSDCMSNSYCQRPTGICGGAGKCSTKPELCAAVYVPVCGCDGRTYPSSCDAAGAGVSIAHPGTC